MLGTALALRVLQKKDEFPKAEPFWIRSQSDGISHSLSRLNTSYEALQECAARSHNLCYSNEKFSGRVNQSEYKKIQDEVTDEIKQLEQVVQHNKAIYKKALEKYNECVARIEKAKGYFIQTLQEEAQEKFNALYQQNEKIQAGQVSSLWNLSAYVPSTLTSIVSLVYTPVAPDVKITEQDEKIIEDKLKSYARFLTAYGRVAVFAYKDDHALKPELSMIKGLEKKSFDEIKVIIQSSNNEVLAKQIAGLELDAQRNEKFFKCLGEHPKKEDVAEFADDFLFKKTDENRVSSLKKRVDRFCGELTTVASGLLNESSKEALKKDMQTVDGNQEKLAKQLLAIIESAIKKNIGYWSKQAWRSRSQIEKIPVPTGISIMHEDFSSDNKKNVWERLESHQRVSQERSKVWFSFWRVEGTTGAFYKTVGDIKLTELTEKSVEQIRNQFVRIGLNLADIKNTPAPVISASSRVNRS